MLQGGTASPEMHSHGQESRDRCTKPSREVGATAPRLLHLHVCSQSFSHLHVVQDGVLQRVVVRARVQSVPHAQLRIRVGHKVRAVAVGHHLIYAHPLLPLQATGTLCQTRSSCLAKPRPHKSFIPEYNAAGLWATTSSMRTRCCLCRQQARSVRSLLCVMQGSQHVQLLSLSTQTLSSWRPSHHACAPATASAGATRSVRSAHCVRAVQGLLAALCMAKGPSCERLL